MTCTSLLAYTVVYIVVLAVLWSMIDPTLALVIRNIQNSDPSASRRMFTSSNLHEPDIQQHSNIPLSGRLAFKHAQLHFLPPFQPAHISQLVVLTVTHIQIEPLVHLHHG